MLYRKQYVSGGIVTAIMAIISIAMNYTAYFVSAGILNVVANDLSQLYPRGYSFIDFFYAIGQLPLDQGIIAILPYALSLINFILMIVIGFTANRTYYKFAVKNIKKIKEQQILEIFDQPSDDEETIVENKNTLNKELMEKGGTNSGIAVCLLVCDMLLSFLPSFFITWI